MSANSALSLVTKVILLVMVEIYIIIEVGT